MKTLSVRTKLAMMCNPCLNLVALRLSGLYVVRDRQRESTRAALLRTTRTSSFAKELLEDFVATDQDFADCGCCRKER